MIIAGIEIDLIFKEIKNIHLAVYPPDGKVRLAVPKEMSLTMIELHVIDKIDWIKKQQQKFMKVERQSARQYISGESHYVFGKRYLLRLHEEDTQKPKVECNNYQHLDLYVKIGSTIADKAKVLEDWYRQSLHLRLIEYVKKWENTLQIQVNQLSIRKMKTHWASCQPKKKKIVFNLELAKKPIPSIEYMVVCQMLYIIEDNHDRVQSRLSTYLPNWQTWQMELNQQMI
jgi:predicted metal-dependent hydrolase